MMKKNENEIRNRKEEKEIKTDKRLNEHKRTGK
jgi:hypothetical protein